MATVTLSCFLRNLTRGMAAVALGDQSDRELVARFLAHHDEAVFEALVRRHGPMVYRVCWRVLQHAHDAEDAFQATFLVLAQKLRTVRKRDSLASWLHGVAHRAALKAKAQAATRREHEGQASVAQAGPPDELTWRELRTVLDGELAQLPEKWRLPLILCYLEGRTQDEAAGQLGWSKSTLVRRLNEAREALGRRLTQKGLTWPAALSAVLLSDCIASAMLSSGLIGSTTEAAACVAAGQAATAGLVSAPVVALTEGVLKTMLLTKLKAATAVLLVVAAVVGGGSGLIFQTHAAQQENTGTAVQPTVQADAKEDKLKNLLERQQAQDMKVVGKYVTVHVAKREVENALKRLREATQNDKQTELEALDEIEKAVKELKEKVKGDDQKLQQAQGKRESRMTLSFLGFIGDTDSDRVGNALHEGRLQLFPFDGKIKVVWSGEPKQLSELEAITKALREGRLRVTPSRRDRFIVPPRKKVEEERAEPAPKAPPKMEVIEVPLIVENRHVSHLVIHLGKTKIDAALKKLTESGDEKTRQQALDEVERAAKEMRDGLRFIASKKKRQEFPLEIRWQEIPRKKKREEFEFRWQETPLAEKGWQFEFRGYQYHPGLPSLPNTCSILATAGSSV